MDVQSMLFSILLIEKNVGMVTECHIGMGSYKKFRFWLLDFRFQDFRFS